MTTGAEIGAEGWLQDARRKLGAATLGAQAEEIGRVEEVGDGIALVSGLPNVTLDELLRFSGGQFGFAQSLERDRIGCVLLDDVDGVEAGDVVRGTGDVVRVPVGPALLGRVVDPLGRPLDGKGPIASETHEPIDRPAPAIVDRDLVVQPVQTGLLVIDALFALGRGQRELIIGDRAIGKTDHRHRHDHQPEDQRHHLRLRRRRTEEFQRPARRRRDPGRWRRRTAASSSRRGPPVRPGCNGSRRSPVSPWPNISAIAASMRWW